MLSDSIVCNRLSTIANKNYIVTDFYLQLALTLCNQISEAVKHRAEVARIHHRRGNNVLVDWNCGTRYEVVG